MFTFLITLRTIRTRNMQIHDSFPWTMVNMVNKFTANAEGSAREDKQEKERFMVDLITEAFLKIY